MLKFVTAFVAALFMALSARVVAECVCLQSSRKVKADIAEIASGEGLRVELSFLAVTTLDEVTNERMSRLMAQSFAEQTVSSFLGAEKTICFSRVKTVSCRFDKSDFGKICSIVYEVPKSALTDATMKLVGSDETGKSWKQFEKACESESRYAMDDFRSGCYRDLRVSEAAFLYEIAQREKRPDELRREIETAFSVAYEKANADDLLMMSEKEALAEKIKTVKSFLLKKLDEDESATSAVDTTTNAKLISEGAFRQKVYKDLLLSDSVLLTVGGCRTFVVGGKAYIVAVGSSGIFDDSPRDRIRRKEVAEENARVEVIKSRRTDVSYFRRSADDVTVGYRDGKESSKESVSEMQVATIKAADYVDSMEIVATWSSADGRLYYLALGAEIKME